MDNDNQEKTFCADETVYKNFCDICDHFALFRYYKNPLKSKFRLLNFVRDNN